MDRLSKPFAIERGVKQGGVISTQVFNAALEAAMGNTPWERQDIQSTVVSSFVM